ncbi:MAG: hypothetical protein HYZ20_19570 [Burkholderiales bacterium]|nr:hypothetical protein [Burkholderiales bacterium]
MPATFPALSSPPAAPQRSAPSTFAALADAWVAWLETWAPDFADAATASQTNATEAYASAVTAAAAANSVGAALWVSGTTYAIGDVRRSPINGLPYRRLTAGAGTTDPSADPTNWTMAAPLYPSLYVVAATAQTAVPWGHYVLTNASATTLTLPASPSAGDAVWVTVGNGRADNVVNRGGNKIMSLAENMTLNDASASLRLRYINATIGWGLV